MSLVRSVTSCLSRLPARSSVLVPVSRLELAARLVADLGLPVVPAAETGQDSGYRHGGAAGQRGHGLAVAGNEVRDEYPPDDFQDFTLTDDDEDDDGYEDEDEDDDYYGSEYDDGGGDGEHGPGGLVSKLMATVRREERKRGKEAADTVSPKIGSSPIPHYKRFVAH